MFIFEFVSYQQLGLAIFVSILNAFILCFISYRLLHIFQLSGYKTRNYVKWVADRRSKFYIRLFSLSVLSFGSMFIVNILFNQFKDINYLSYLGLVFYFYLAIVFIASIWQAPTKVSLKLTSRVKRLLALLFVVCMCLTYFIIWLGSREPFLRFSLVAFIPMVLPFIMLLCNYLLWPIESTIRVGFIGKAKLKLRKPEFANLIRIGITGSYGKTSCKNILAAMLESKYSVAASPSSFNTPMGFTKTVNNILTEGNDVLIFEMGARYPNDIKYLAKLFKAKHGILTSIGPQHIETFGNIENIKRAKSDLLRALPKEDGMAIVNGDSEKCMEAFNELELVNKFASSITKMAKDIKITQEGCEFTLKLDGENPVKCVTRLLGKHNIENIIMCAMLANKMGVSAGDIAIAISRLAPTPHRLELVKADNGLLILDDSYNASPGGTVAALEVLSLFKGKKVVMTPGLVELGIKQDEENFKFGVRLARVADKVIVVNELNKSAITDGLKSQSFPMENIYTVKTLEEAKAVYTIILKAGDVLLIENDLPDNYL